MTVAKALRLLLLVILILASWGAGYVQAYDATVVNSLNKTRDALLDQRLHLQQRADAISQRVAELNRQLDLVNSYLRDTDRNLRDVEDALKRVK